MASNEKQMKLRYAGVCRFCGAGLAVGTEAIYERSMKTIRCLDCSRAAQLVEVPAKRVPNRASVVEPVATAESIDVGIPGASARREGERRRVRRKTRVREKHPKLGGLILAATHDPQSTTAWMTGALGEERLGERLNEISSDTMRVLHDRRIPGTRANIDHIAVTPTGIYVIDAKKYKGRPSLRVEGGILRPRVEKLLVGSRDQTKLVDGVIKQVDIVCSIVGDDVPVTGVLCFIEADWPLLGGSFRARGVEVLWPKKFYPRLTADGAFASQVDALHRKLAAALPLA
ncbi:hypothetical protein GCM10023350_36000 [Nocardioides endophyticus]|uniref:NERD domain-containing protein n=1 Tax=Nocardioides endophyticus TaxID=1353775 RepID=A0ABP8Z6G0_9ACTN